MSFTTPKKRRLVDPVLDLTDEDENGEQLEGEAIDWQEIEHVIGPTPQKNGRILGLFDCLSPERLNVPSVSPRSAKRKVAEAFPALSKRSAAKHSKSPLKTPSFLRKQVITVDADGSTNTPRLLFPALPKRGLSFLINELRELEDNDEDEGLNVLREMEAEFPSMNEERSDGDKDNEKDETVTNEKVKWKKKGLKRSHRRVIMRPSTSKKKGNEEAHAVQELDVGSDSDEFMNSEDEAADELAARGIQVDSNAGIGPVNKTTIADQTASRTRKSQDSAPLANNKRRPRTGPQNYKSLKLRNRGSKGGGGRFRGKGR